MRKKRADDQRVRATDHAKVQRDKQGKVNIRSGSHKCDKHVSNGINSDLAWPKSRKAVRY